MQKLYEMYKGNPNVVFAIVNVWERTEDRMKIVQDFLSKSPELSFPVYFDMDDSVVSKYGVTGIPTKFFLGKDGRIQFKEVGLAPDEQFIEDSSKKIDVLLAQ
jgi:thiol-disulfide isomerase/thioredoxin